MQSVLKNGAHRATILNAAGSGDKDGFLAAFGTVKEDLGTDEVRGLVVSSQHYCSLNLVGYIVGTVVGN